MKSVIIRADSSSTIGAGHIMRDLVLAKEFKDKRVIFATRNLPGNINYKIEEEGFKIASLKTNSLEEFIGLIEKYNAQIVIIDNYEIDEAYEKALKQKTGVTIMVLDDTYEKHYCDILLNHNIYADPNRYKDLVPDHCELRCGKEYTLLRDEFIEAKKNLSKFNIQHSTFNIFIAMGGADNSNITTKILKALEAFDNIHLNVVTTTANKNLNHLKEYIASKNNVTLHINTDKIAELMAKSDLAIVTPSVTLNEVFFMELPFIAIQTADNQREMTKYLEKNNYAVLRQFEDTILKKYLANVIKGIK
ncbi:UDP-2,4-diacetamido-2,4,6-trideoxy-beta-L-altropyranose hydrolase [Hydrogenimonas thermophila]|uniref:UDP-2,4-diacetamido-2,4, 6-trideoxy-beta-L-altropyranose hydrolase n=1 Tax=Hydrogenimonas thermophila TaxID=223786 RepID=UPI002936E5BD|nr:UDP-2,4-diacetamido-2,4,6-trideoxy-beta-L-altropyranose hydrolase [Hydrogenimonas thermophila]WOE69933.1 UDP-2,4-diacetamido-2,4,6-trideoxy-beta-L-altropyranose hydrolase [Hydrogenimonas thermophila]WOE72450.1 UDP-2,4-diacetamido-2,4,6-trideoxy-beta-L-altropyranose hydrolase [Hydrogenimonas thermophila]